MIMVTLIGARNSRIHTHKVTVNNSTGGEMINSSNQFNPMVFIRVGSQVEKSFRQRVYADVGRGRGTDSHVHGGIVTDGG